MTMTNKMILNNGDTLVLTGAEIEGDSYTAGINKRDLTYVTLGNKIKNKSTIVAITEELELEFTTDYHEYVIEISGGDLMSIFAPDEDPMVIAAKMNNTSNLFFNIGNNVLNKNFVTGVEKLVKPEVDS